MNIVFPNLWKVHSSRQSGLYTTVNSFEIHKDFVELFTCQIKLMFKVTFLEKLIARFTKKPSSNLPVTGNKERVLSRPYLFIALGNYATEKCTYVMSLEGIFALSPYVSRSWIWIWYNTVQYNTNTLY